MPAEEGVQEIDSPSRNICPRCGRAVNNRTTGCVFCLLQAGLEEQSASDRVVDAPLPNRKENLNYDHYRLVRHSDGSAYELGRGGMGVTYKAFDTNLHSYVAIKTIYPPLLQNKKLRERFEREARLAARFRHPSVASIYYLKTSASHCFYAMELVEGESVEQLVERAGPVDTQFALEIAAEVADALAAAEKLRLVHRDIKPSNLMLTRVEDGKTRVKIIDFGVALWLDPQTSGDAEHLTQAGLVGTAHFASPEQLRHEPLDSRSDIYSLGATLWFMISGKPPFSGSTGEVIEKQLRAAPPFEQLPPLRTCVRQLLECMLQKEPAARPANAAALRARIEECRQKISRFPTGQQVSRPMRFAVSRTKLMIGLLTVCVLGALAVWSWRGGLLQQRTPAATKAGSGEGEQSIAVLPFHLLTQDEQSKRFAEAVQDEILTGLAHNKRLTVISAGSANNPRLEAMPPAEKGAALGVTTLLEGNLQRNGEQYRINARLVAARTGKTLFARVFGGDQNDLFGLQKQIAQEMTARLQPDRPEEAAPGVPTENVTAYEAYLQGREWERRVENEMSTNAKKAAEYYEQAVTLDPTFALAEASLASAYARLYWQEDDWQLRQTYLAKAQQAVQQAVKLQPSLPEVHAAVGYYYYYGHRDYDHALKEFWLAQKNLPNDSDVALALGLVLRRKAAWDESVESFLRASRLDPLNSRILAILSDTYSGLRRYQEEDQILTRELALKPDDPELRLQRAYLRFKQTDSTAELRQVVQANDPAHESDSAGFARWDVDMLERKFDEAVSNIQMSPREKFEDEFGIFPKDLLCGLALWAKGDTNAARPYFEKSRVFMEPVVQKNTEGPRLRVSLALAYAGLGRKAEAMQQARLAKEERPPEVDPVGGPPIVASVARVYVMVGDKQAALHELAPLLKMPFGLSRSRARFDPCWDPLRGIPEFEDLLK
jgi:TolB-like protein/tetratricopeptide (TPR) repeat protein